jgi:FtsP/CotA-like multicopper oxidase with cupredoxin domain/plastocyanin
MATRELWIQIEPNQWDLCPHNIDRMTGMNIQDREAAIGNSGLAPRTVTLTSPVTGHKRSVKMFKPLDGGALILRRYTANWAAPDDRKVNPWDINELDPTDNGTMGTIPGPVIELDVGDDVIVHFRNGDHRREPRLLAVETIVNSLVTSRIDRIGDVGGIRIDPNLFTQPIDFRKRTHSLHPHGVVFAPTSDGAYPLSPQDHSQPIPAAEKPFWDEVGVSDFKQGDRVPSGATFDYHWQTLGWPTTAGVWLYHDHSINDEENVNRGAIGIIVVHNPNEADKQQDVEPQDLPGGSLNGSPIIPGLIRFDQAFDLNVNLLPSAPFDMSDLGMSDMAMGDAGGGAAGMGGMEMADDAPAPKKAAKKAAKKSAATKVRKDVEFEEMKAEFRVVTAGDIDLVVNRESAVVALLKSRFRTPPTKAVYLQLFHMLQNGAMCINGRQYLGNTPTVVAGTNTLMRFGVVGMGSDFHTFHLHGHRWTLNGPDGDELNLIMNSPQVRPVSQFEDTRTFGPANSFVFSIDEGNGFMRASPANGEWHMHCHVLNHMMSGMMGSLLIVNGGDVFFGLPHGVPMPGMGGMNMGGGGGGPTTTTVHVQDFQFVQKDVSIHVGDTVVWSVDAAGHTVTDDGGAFAFGTVSSTLSVNAPNIQHTYNTAGAFPYHCAIHGGPGGVGMSGTVHVTS